MENARMNAIRLDLRDKEREYLQSFSDNPRSYYECDQLGKWMYHHLSKRGLLNYNGAYIEITEAGRQALEVHA
jgi:hypothetical protein